MLKYSDVRSVHLEVTDKCNASCPMCARNINGGPLNPNLRLVEMTLEEAKKIFSPGFLQQLKFIQLCGNFGDPITAKDTLEILQFFRGQNPKLSLGVHTNGGIKPPSWWAQLGNLLSRPGDYCKFGLDGLADTNHIYRRGTLWAKIMANVEAFISSGGVAHWEFLVFKHNEHQIEEARSLARKMGFHEFYVKKTSRFFNYKNGQNEPFPVYDKSGATIDHLYPPANEELLNPVSRFQELRSTPFTVQNALTEKMQAHVQSSVENAKTLIESYGTLNKYLEETGIDCMSSRERSIYITARGEVYPCCFLGGQVRYSDPGVDGERLNLLMNETCGSAEGISAIRRTLPSVMDEGWFSGIQANWSLPANSPQSVHTCRRMCGKNLQLVSGEYA